MLEKKLGKISHAEFGQGGYQDAMLGFSVTFSGEGWGVSDFWGAWGIERSDNAEWTEEDRIKQLGEMNMRLNQTLTDAKKKSVGDLVGVPVEVTFDGNRIKSWRVLSEVL